LNYNNEVFIIINRLSNINLVKIITIRNKNWVENYRYLHSLSHTFQDLKQMPRSREELEAYYRRIDSDIPMNEFEALLKRTREYLGQDIIFINKIRNRLSDDEIVTKRDFNKFWKKVCIECLELEKQRSEIHGEISPEEKEKHKLIEEYKEEIEEFLKSETKFKLITEILDYKIVREEKNKLLLFLLLSGAYFNRHQITMIIGESTGGKSYIVDNVLELFPDSDAYSITGASNKAIIYKDWTKEKILNIPEAQRNAEVLECLKDFGDRGIVYITVERNENGHYETVEKTIGLLSVVITTTIEKMNPQLENRAWRLEPDLSLIQSREIVNSTLNMVKDKINQTAKKTYIKKLENYLKFTLILLEDQYNIDDLEIPFADIIKPLFNYHFLKIRRDHKKFLALLEIISSWNFKLRESYKFQSKKIQLVHPNDLLNFFIVAEEIFMNLTQNITPEKNKIISAFEELLEISNQERTKQGQKNLLDHLDETLKKSKEWFKTKTIYRHFCSIEEYRKSQRTFRNLLNALVEDGYLEKDTSGRENQYRLFDIPILKILEDFKRKELFALSYIVYEKRKNHLKNIKDIELTEVRIQPLIDLESIEIFKVYKRILEIFEDNDFKDLPIENVIHVISNDFNQNEKVIDDYLNIFLKNKIFTKNPNEELVYNNSLIINFGRLSSHFLV